MKHNGGTSQAEFRAIIAIAFILIITLAYPVLHDKIFPPSSQEESCLALEGYSIAQTPDRDGYDDENHFANFSDQKTYRSFKQKARGREGIASNSGKAGATRFAKQQEIVVCRTFDPNTVSKDDLIQMGVNPYAADNLIKYRQSGATFRKPTDVRRIYGIDSTLFVVLEGCIEIQNTGMQLQQLPSVDINTASLEEWKSLPGIGEVLAARIIKYRDILGGFHSITQLSETYGLPAETFQLISQRLHINSAPRPLDLNKVTVEELAAHPYVTERQAEAIVSFRNHHGNFMQIEDVLKIYSLNQDWFVRMQPYLSCFEGGVTETGIVSR